jgi:hypothetical protein
MKVLSSGMFGRSTFIYKDCTASILMAKGKLSKYQAEQDGENTFL